MAHKGTNNVRTGWQHALRGVGGLCSLFTLVVGASDRLVWAEPTVESPNNRFVFQEDTKDAKKARRTREQELLAGPAASTGSLDLAAPTVEFQQEKNRVVGKGGVLISGIGNQAQAEQGTLNSTTSVGELEGNVLFSTTQGAIASRSAVIDFERETGTFRDSAFDIEQDGFSIKSPETQKLSETEYELASPRLTTCHCAERDTACLEAAADTCSNESAPPWAIRGSSATVTQEGYAHVYDARMELYGVPVFYVPYFFFPVKQERASGLLAPEFGYNKDDGLSLRAPTFLALSDTSDMTLTPFLQQHTRAGSEVEYRQRFSTRSQVLGRVVYSDETARDGELRGTVVDNLFDKSIDDHRVGVLWQQSWRSERDAWIPSQFLTDIHYVSDDLFLREFDDESIGRRQSRFATSTVAFRAMPLDFVTAEARGEYNQSLVDVDDDLLFQRLPEFSVDALKSFRPFGANQFGLKLVSRANVEATKFVRSDGYDGWRTDLQPGLSVPFHVRNFVNGSVGFTLNQTQYRLDETEIPGAFLSDGTPAVLGDSDSRTIWAFTSQLGTGFERVFDMTGDRWFGDLFRYGAENQGMQLARVKHVIEPLVRYTYVPNEDQDKLPIFDGFDRVREKSLITYGVKTALYGRFVPDYAGAEKIPELTPRIEDVPVVDALRTGTVLGVGDDAISTDGGVVRVRDGEIRELINFSVRQSYNFSVEEQSATTRALSDVEVKSGIYPSKYVGVVASTNYGVEEHSVASWALAGHVKDDRGDALRARYSFIDNSVSQVEGQAELVLSDRLKVGYYARYDDLEQEFIEKAGALRFFGSCGCWHIDLGFRDRLNPDKEQYLLQFTMNGLGGLTQSFGVDNRQGGAGQ